MSAVGGNAFPREQRRRWNSGWSNEIDDTSRMSEKGQWQRSWIETNRAKRTQNSLCLTLFLPLSYNGYSLVQRLVLCSLTFFSYFYFLVYLGVYPLVQRNERDGQTRLSGDHWKERSGQRSRMAFFFFSFRPTVHVLGVDEWVCRSWITTKGQQHRRKWFTNSAGSSFSLPWPCE